MKTFWLYLLFGITLINMQNVKADECSTDLNKYKELVLQIKTNQIKQIEFIYIPTNVLTYRPITPDVLERNFNYKFVVRHLPDWSKSVTLSKALNLEKPRISSDTSLDIRWGCTFYTQHDVKIISIFLTGDGKKGFINDCPVVFNTSFYQWLKENIKKCFE